MKQMPNLHLLLVGEEDTTDPISSGAREWLRHDTSLHWTGGVATEDMPAIYAATDLCVVPSFREGLSQVALESGAMGVPVVASKVSGLVNSVEDGVTGLLVAPAEPAILADALLRLAAQPALCREFGRAAIEHVRTKFSDDRVNNLWMAEYRSLVADATEGSVDESPLTVSSPAALRESNLP